MPNIQIIKSKRRSISLEIKDGALILRAPLRIKDEEINEFLERHKSWIEKHSKKASESKEKAAACGMLSDLEIEELRTAAKAYLPKRTAELAASMGIKYNVVTVRLVKTRWGSCSSKRNISFNLLLMLTPPEVIDSVIVHELCHIRHMNHSKAFYKEIYKYYPEYDEWNKWLRDNGEAILFRVSG